MDKKPSVFPILLIVVFGLAFAAGVKFLRQDSGAKATKIAFETDASVAFAKAKKEGKAVMVDFNADWCGPCQLMEKEAFTDAGVAELLRGVVPVSVDVDNPGPNQELLEKNPRLALPTVVFYDADGEEIGRTVGYGGVEDFKSEIVKIIGRP